MDSNTHRRLQQINMEEAMKRKKTLVKKEKPWAQEKAQLEELMKDKRLDAQTKKKLGTVLRSNLYDRETLTVNEKVSQDLERAVSERIKQDIRSGRLKPAERDSWMRRQEEWQKGRR